MTPRIFFISLTSALFALASAGCGTPVPTSIDPLTTVCASNTASIRVGDGFLQRLCGCEGGTVVGPGEPVAAPGTLNCTVTTGTLLVFNYVGIQVRHQIISVGASSFQSSPISDPLDPSSAKIHAIRLESPGTYTFQEAFTPGLGGTITVN